jgi:hypothetical protein
VAFSDVGRAPRLVFFDHLLRLSKLSSPLPSWFHLARIGGGGEVVSVLGDSVAMAEPALTVEDMFGIG